ncbi:hypothetical protein pqer_cds_948 [Pandoravirus quercus]|uniref:Uncharacterized protein n=1 Tax=Pandoravirus quercus TaxID=2107709 RepID=A0A2U7UAG2_9VIRU|nr:hypothetical protein pqer_cds_948 [Pandoravirus quercus]AVK75370.1 hypothetical protein pqer_cds_948 [Pandoravirus quercus]
MDGSNNGENHISGNGASRRPAKRARRDASDDDGDEDDTNLVHKDDHSQDAPVCTVDIEFVASESVHIVASGVDVAGLCARSAYFAAMLAGGFAEADVGARGGSISVRLPMGRVDANALGRLAGILDGTAQPTAADALGLSRYLLFFEAAPCLRECKEALATALCWTPSLSPSSSPPSSTTPSPLPSQPPSQQSSSSLSLPRPVGPDPYAILALYALAVTQDDTFAHWADLQSGLFTVDAVWRALTQKDGADDGGDDTSGPQEKIDLTAYVGCGDALVEAASRVARSDVDGSPCAAILLDLVQDTPGLLAAATADAMSDWFAPLAPARALLNTPFALSACRVTSPMGALFETTCAHPVGTVVPCFVPSHEAFAESLVGDSPRIVGAILSAGVLGPNAVLAGGAVVNAMQSAPLRHRLGDSDVDMWIVGDDERDRRRAFARVIGALFDALPDARVTVRGSVVTFVVDTTTPQPTASFDGVSIAQVGDTVATDMGNPTDGDNHQENTETLQVIYTDVQTAHDVIDDFDLTHACAYYDGTDVCASWTCVWSVVSRVTLPLPGVTPNPRRLARAAAKGFASASPDVVPAPLSDVNAGPPDEGASDRACNDRGDDVTAMPLVDRDSVGDSHNNNHKNEDNNNEGNSVIGRDVNLPGNDYGSLWGMASDIQPVAYDTAAALLAHFTHASMVSNSVDGFPRLEIALQTDVTPLAAIARVRVPPLRTRDPMVCSRCSAPDTSPNAWCLGGRRCAGVSDDLPGDRSYAITVSVTDDNEAVRARACRNRLRAMDAEIEALHTRLANGTDVDRWGESVPWVPMIATIGAMDDGGDDDAKPTKWRTHLRYTKYTTIRDALTGEVLVPRRVGAGSYIAARLAVYGVAHNDICTTPARHCRLLLVYPPHLWHVVGAIERALAPPTPT